MQAHEHTSTDVPTHPWELQGLGKAPFYCTGMRDLGGAGQLITVGETAEGVTIQTTGGGSCHACWTLIRYAFAVESADGKKFHVGSDCVDKAGDARLAQQVREYRRAARAELRTALREAARRSERLDREARRAADRAAHEATFGVQLEQCAAVVAVGGWGAPIATDFAEQMREQGRGLTMPQAALLKRMYREATDTRPKAHVGSPGARAELVLVPISCTAREGSYGWTYTQHYEDADGNRLVWYGSRPLMEMERLQDAMRASTPLRVRATVKKHDVRDGQPVTVLTRVAVSS